MALPKTVTINGLIWEIQYEPCDSLGHCDCNKRVIVVDNESDESRQKEILMHELLEVCMLEQRVTYKSYPLNGDTDCLFVMNHRQFRAISKTFSGVISQIDKG